MAISRLNTLFTKHHRIIFGVFAILIIIAFVLADWIGGGGSFFGNSMRDDQVAEVFGEKVSAQELNDQMRLESLYYFMQTAGQFSIPREYLEMQAVQNLAMLKMAKRSKISATDEEVTEAVCKMQLFFNKEGKFDVSIYKQYIDKAVIGQGFTEEDFTTVMRQKLIMQKFAEVLNSGLIVTDAERDVLKRVVSQQFEVLSCRIKSADFVKTVKVDAAALDKFFAAARDNYMIPAKLNALVVEFTPDVYMAAVKVSDKELEDYYEANKNDFAVVKDGKQITPAFAQVKAQVKVKVTAEKALAMARDEARKFASDAYDMIADKPAGERLNTFNDVVKKGKIKVVATGVFSADGNAAGAFKSAALVKALADCGGDVPLSEAIEDGNSTFVGYVTEFQPARNAEFKEVADRVKQDYINAESVKLARARAQEIADKLKAMPVATRVARAKSSKSAVFTAKPVFSQMGPRELFADPANGNLPRVFSMLPGDISEPLLQQDGFELLLLVSRKAPAAGKEDFMLNYLATESLKQKVLMPLAIYTQANTKTMTPQEGQQAAE